MKNLMLMLAVFLSGATSVQAGQSEVRLAEKVIKINEYPCGKVLKATKVQDTKDYLDVRAECSNKEIYRVGILYGRARDVKTIIRCSVFGTNKDPYPSVHKEDGAMFGITPENCAKN